MRGTLSRGLSRVRSTFAAFTPGQKMVAVIGSAALLLGGFLVFRWAAAPTYTPLFSNLADSDASAIIDQLDATGVPYQIGAGGTTIMVPSDQVYATRIALSGDGLPGASDSGGYHLLDNQSISTSQFQEQTSFKRAMEGELTNTIEAIDGVDAAVVHLAMPPKEVFSDQQDPTTASVLVQTRAGATLTPEQVQAVVNLVSSSVDGLAPEKVTVADSTGQLLSTPGSTGFGAAQSENQQVTDFENQKTSQVQAMLDRIFGVGNATVQTTAQLSFDKTVTDSMRYFDKVKTPLSETADSEKLTGSGTITTPGGTVGPDGNVEPTPGATGTDSGSTYDKKGFTKDNALDSIREHREAAPGGVESLHLGIVIDPRALKGADLNVVQTNIAAALGLDKKRGDTIDVSSMAIDRTAETAAAAELAAAQAADKKAATMAMARNGGLVLLLVLIVLVSWLQARRRAKARAQATTYVVEQLRQDAAARQAPALEAQPSPAVLALEMAQSDESTQLRDEIAALVERQPEDVAALLRGWLVDPT